MIFLNNVDLIIIDSINPQKAIETIKICKKNIKFKNVFLFTHLDLISDNYNLIKIDEIKNINEYSNFCLKLSNYLENDYTLLIQNDGFIINHELWQDDFLKYDYIGAPWNLTPVPGHRVGNGGFSLRSKKFLEFASQFDSTDGIPEDNFLCIENYYKAIQFGIKFAPLKIAALFAHEFHNPQTWDFNPKNHFGFHGKENVPLVMDFILKKENESL